MSLLLHKYCGIYIKKNINRTFLKERKLLVSIRDTKDVETGIIFFRIYFSVLNKYIIDTVVQLKIYILNKKMLVVYRRP